MFTIKEQKQKPTQTGRYVVKREHEKKEENELTRHKDRVDQKNAPLPNMR